MIGRLASGLLLLGASLASAWESSLFVWDPGLEVWQSQTVSYAGRSWSLPDFSRVGFERGELAPGSGTPCTEIAVGGRGDITVELQAAIDAVGAAGGGVVRIPEGVFVVSASIEIPWDRVSIRGAGSARTILAVPAGYDPTDDQGEGVFTFGKTIGGWSKGWIDRGVVRADVDGPVEEGSRLVPVASPGVFSLGEWVVVRQYFWPAFSAANSSSPGAWGSISGWPDPVTSVDRRFSFTYLRKITGILPAAVEVDLPVPRRLDPADNPVKIQSAVDPVSFAPAHHVGLAGVTIDFADNLSHPDGRPSGAGVYFEGVRDGWVHDVVVHDMPRFGIYLNSSARITVSRSAVYDAQDYGGGGWGYAFHVSESQDVLVTRCYAEETRHGFLTQRALTSGVVFSECESAAAREGGDDTHHSFIHGLLWDRHRLRHGTGLHSIMRGSTSGGAWETHGSSVLWNLDGDGCLGGWFGGSVQLNPSSDGWCAMVGGPGDHRVWDAGASLGTGEEMPADPGLQVGATGDGPGLGARDQNVLYEGLHTPGLEPASLYRAQLASRLGTVPEEFAATCGPVEPAPPFAPGRFVGNGVLVFDSDRLGWVSHPGSGCLDCDIDDPVANHTPGGAESMRFQVSDTSWSIATSFRGCPVTPAAGDRLEMRVFPTSPSWELRVRLQHSVLPDTDTIVGDVIVGAATAGAWNLVRVPLDRIGAGSFNVVQLRSVGPESASPFWVDDIRIVPAGPSEVPDGSNGEPMRVARLDASGDDLRLFWDPVSCGAPADHHLVYGTVDDLAPGPLVPVGAACDLGDGPSAVWTSPSLVPGQALWWLLLADDDDRTEGPWGAERSGPGPDGSSGVCGIDSRTSTGCGA